MVLEVEEWGGKGAFERGVSGRMISLFSFSFLHVVLLVLFF